MGLLGSFFGAVAEEVLGNMQRTANKCYNDPRATDEWKENYENNIDRLNSLKDSVHEYRKGQE